MKAIHISHFTPDVHSITPTDVPAPTPQGEQNVHVRITHAAVTHVDLLYAQGLHQNNKRHVQPPFILGTEFAGTVISSPSSSTLQPGTRVFGGGLGAFAEEICVPEASIRSVPGQWSNADACAVGASGAVSYGALHSIARLQRGESLCILGASGGLGVMAVQIAKAAGCNVVAVVGSDAKADVVRRVGADHVVSYRDRRWEDAVRAASPGGQGVDVVYDAIGAVESGIKCLKYRGRLVIVGFAARGGKMEKVRANRILLKSAMVLGYRFGEDGRHDPQRTKDAWNGFMRLVEDGSVKPVVYEEEYRGLEAVARALEDAKEHRAWGRAVVRINEGTEKGIEDEAAVLRSKAVMPKL
ncbi:transcription elongation factor spt5 [Curvularia kusanoi]|uniref:Transcription elongation factor spt5 n=1 Tax=Curvularia kusanoi TaxID=90978 RepID=A0A9P4W7I0_CURKU|nr:transcription elongation factor spt5 [Curvularia kusanoi]